MLIQCDLHTRSRARRSVSGGTGGLLNTKDTVPWTPYTRLVGSQIVFEELRVLAQLFAVVGMPARDDLAGS